MDRDEVKEMFDTGQYQMPANLLNVAWRKAQASNPNGDCVELATVLPGVVAIRNSRAPEGTALLVTKTSLAYLLQAAKTGELDDLIEP